MRLNGVPNLVALSALVKALLKSNVPRKRLPAAIGLFIKLPKPPVRRVVSASALPDLPLST